MSVTTLYEELLTLNYTVHTALTLDFSQEVKGLGPEVNELLDHLGNTINSQDLGNETKFELVITDEEGGKYGVDFSVAKYLDFADRYRLSEFLIDAINQDRKHLLNNIYYA